MVKRKEANPVRLFAGYVRGLDVSDRRTFISNFDQYAKAARVGMARAGVGAAALLRFDQAVDAALVFASRRVRGEPDQSGFQVTWAILDELADLLD